MSHLTGAVAEKIRRVLGGRHALGALVVGGVVSPVVEVMRFIDRYAARAYTVTVNNTGYFDIVTAPDNLDVEIISLFVFKVNGTWSFYTGGNALTVLDDEGNAAVALNPTIDGNGNITLNYKDNCPLFLPAGWKLRIGVGVHSVNGTCQADGLFRFREAMTHAAR